MISQKGLLTNVVISIFLLHITSTVFPQLSLLCIECKVNANRSFITYTDEVIFKDICYENIFYDIVNISSFGSRVTGYEGANKTASYIASKLSSLGLKVLWHPFNVVVPLDLGSSIIVSTFEGEKLYKAYALWPNGVQTSPTPPEGLSGRLIYVGKGDLKDFDGKDVDGSIVLMDYESGDNWLNAAKLGAKAVVFIAPPRPSTYSEAIKKFLDTPLYFPRLYVSYETGLDLVEASKKSADAKIYLKMYYRKITAYNIVGVLEGSQKDEVIIISSHYDSWSSVPALANSPYEVISAAYLLELARILSRTRTFRTVWFVFFSGHWQALSGSREFIEDYYFSPEVQNGTIRPLLLINIGDLDPSGLGLDLIRGGAGTYFATVSTASGISTRYSWIRQQIFTNYLSHLELTLAIQNLTGSTPSTLVKDFFTNTMFWGTENSYYMLDSEPAEMTGGVAFTIQSSYARKNWKGDPYNYEISLDEINRLAPQLMIAAHIISSFINEPTWGIKWTDISPKRIILYNVWGGFVGFSSFITLKGKTLEYNLSAGWYSAVPNALVRVHAGVDSYPFNDYLTFSDNDGFFEVHGLSAYTFIPSGRYFIEAWVIDDLSGRIIYAPNLGIYGAKSILPMVSPLSHPDECSVVLMKVGTVALFDVINPQTGITGLIPDLRSPTGIWFYDRGCSVMVQNFDYKGEPFFYGVYYNNYEPVALIFALPGSKIMSMATLGGLNMPPKPRPFLILVNSSETEPEGHGITVLEEKTIVYCGNALKYARDILLITKARYNSLKSHGVQSISVEEKIAKAEEYFKEAMDKYSHKVFSQAYTKALVAWAWSVRAYEEVMSLIDDSGKTSLFFFALIIITALLFERLLFHFSGKKQIICVILIGTLLLLFFNVVHPALTVMANSLMAVIGLIALVLFIFTASVLADETQKVLKDISYRLLGRHTIETGRVSLIVTALTVSIENMRKRRFRTLLVLLNLIVVSFALTALTSISPYIGVKYVPLGINPAYSGILIKNGESTPPRDILGPYTVDIIRGVVEEGTIIAPRAWYYPSSIGPNIGVITRLSTIDGKNITYPINAALGLIPQDAYLLFSKYSAAPILPLVEENWCLIPDSAAEVLNVNVGDYVILQGTRFKVAGIYNTSLIGPYSLTDLRGTSIAPIDPYYVSALGISVVVPLMSGQQPPPLSWSRLIVIPFKAALDLGGYVAEISLKFSSDTDKEYIMKLAHDLANILDITVYVGIDEHSFVASRISTFTTFGLEGMVVLMILGSFNVVATLLAVQKERIRDMFVYTTVGLSPTGATMMAILESLTYSTLGVAIGYFLGFIGNKIFRELGVLPATFTFNYASIFAMVSLLLLLLAALISSYYPARVASMLITPSLERKWKPPTKPKDGLWEMPLPLRINQVEEVKGLILFLKEYYFGAGVEKQNFRVDYVKINLSDPENLGMKIAVSLAPYEAGVKEIVDISARWSDAEKSYLFVISIQKERGEESIWIKGSYEFVDDLRRQILLWRFLPKEERAKYIDLAKAI
jgi:ABC-type antimicrobial peptide transport system permease subunit